MNNCLKKGWKLLLCSMLLSMLFSCSVYAEWTGDETMSSWQTLREFCLKGGETGKEVLKLRSGIADKDVKSLKEKYDSTQEVEISASIDGVNPSKLFWSRKRYKDLTGDKTAVAVLKAGTSKKWSKQSGIILKVSDINGFVTGIEIEMAASENGPRDYKIEYSVDGETFYAMENVKDSRFSLSEPYIITIPFQKDISQIQRMYTTVQLTDGQYDSEVKIYEDIYFKVSPASDYKVNGKKGLYGSSEGEMAICAVRLNELSNSSCKKTLNPPSDVKVYKNAVNRAKITWNKVSGVDGYEIYLKEEGEAYKKIATVRGTGKAERQIRNLSKDGIYKVRIRSYVKDGSKKEYSSYKTVALNMKKQVIPKDLSMNKKVGIKVGSSKKLQVKCAEGKNKSYIENVQYRVKNADIATISNGILKAKKAGTTSVTTKVILKSGLTKTFTTEIIVKEK